jgi:hypothetical protein
LLLVPGPHVRRHGLNLNYNVRIWRDVDGPGWYLRDRDSDDVLFAFGIPEDLLALYKRAGVLTARDAQKHEVLGTLQAITWDGDTVGLVTFQLDREWLQTLLARQR